MEMQERIYDAARANLMKAQAEWALAEKSAGRIPQVCAQAGRFDRPTSEPTSRDADNAESTRDRNGGTELNLRYKMAQARCAVRLFYAKKAFEESKHPRASKGSPTGGQFVKTGHEHDNTTSRTDLAWARGVLATRPKSMEPPLPKKNDNSNSPEYSDHKLRNQAFFSIPAESPTTTSPISPQRVLETQQHIVRRQNGIDALTKQRAAAASEVSGIRRLPWRGGASNASQDRIKHLEAQIAFCDNLVQQFRTEVNEAQKKLTPGQRVPELPALKATGPRQVDGGTPGRTMIQDAFIMSALSSASYNLSSASDDDQELPDNLKKSGWKLKRIYHESQDGFHAALFENQKTGEHVLGFAGTNSKSVKDIAADITQGLGFRTSQYKKAIELAAKLKQEYPNLRLTGHSLGGGLASAASIVNRIGGTVTFNAAAVHPFTVWRYGMNLSDAPGLISAFRVKGEFLSSGQDGRDAFGHLLHSNGAATLLLPHGVGTNYWLDASGWDPFARHEMKYINEGLQNALDSNPNS